MDFDDEVRICFKTHYYLDDETYQKITELIKTARTTINYHQSKRQLVWADSLASKGYIPKSRWLLHFNSRPANK